MVMRYLFLLLVLTSCSTAYHCRKCFDNAQVKRDTIKVDTTIYIPSVRLDTVVRYDLSTDTLVIEKDRVKIKYRDLPGPTVYLSAECPSDTIVIKKEIPVTTRLIVEKKWPSWKIITAIVAALFLGALLMSVFRG